MRALSRPKPVALLATALAFAACVREAGVLPQAPEGRDIGPDLWRYFEPTASRDTRDPMLERVKTLAARERARTPSRPADTRPETHGEPPALVPTQAEGEGARSALQEIVPASGAAAFWLAPGDELDLAVGGRPEFSGPVAVRDDGRVALPSTGDLVAAAGLTTGQLAEAVAGALHPHYLRAEPEVSVSLRSSPRLVYYVFGAVRRPGTYSMPPAGVTVLDAVLAASQVEERPEKGGPAVGTHDQRRAAFEPVRGARYERVHVVTPEGGGARVRIVDLASAMRGERASRDVVPPGSRVIVPERSGRFSEAELERTLYPDGLVAGSSGPPDGPTFRPEGGAR